MSATPAVSLRTATRDDLATALAWSPDKEAFRLWAGPQVEFGLPLEQMWHQITPAPRMTFALETGAMVGMGQLVFNEPLWGHLARLIIAPDRRSEGYGRTLCRELMALAQELQPKLIGYTLFVYPHNSTALKLYRSLGFDIVGESDAGLKMQRIVGLSGE